MQSAPHMRSCWARFFRATRLYSPPPAHNTQCTLRHAAEERRANSVCVATVVQVAEEILLNFFDKFVQACGGWEPDELHSPLACEQAAHCVRTYAAAAAAAAAAAGHARVMRMDYTLVHTRWRRAGLPRTPCCTG